MLGTDNVVRVKVAVLCVLLHVHTVITATSEDHELTAISSSFVLPWEASDVSEIGGSVVAGSKTRVKRAAKYTNRDVEGFSEEEKKILVEKHNALRRQDGSSDMMYMYWDDDVAAFAQKWADNCAFKHSSQNSRKDIGSHSFIGENLYASTGSYDPDNLVQLWYDEISYYNYYTGDCTKVCGHYTQVVWAKSYALGCGVRYCPNLANVDFRKGFLVSCNYGPAGNYIGEKPFQKGEACSACEPDAPYCVQGLCAKFPVVIESDDDGASRASQVFFSLGCCAVSAILAWMVT